MLAVVVTLCLKSDPATCADHVVVWLPKQSVEMCLAAAAPDIHAFVQSYPNSLLHQATCMVGRR